MLSRYGFQKNGKVSALQKVCSGHLLENRESGLGAGYIITISCSGSSWQEDPIGPHPMGGCVWTQ